MRRSLVFCYDAVCASIFVPRAFDLTVCNSDTIRRNKVMLKGPITTPSGGGYKSLNVTMRKVRLV